VNKDSLISLFSIWMLLTDLFIALLPLVKGCKEVMRADMLTSS
jgi:hypothetical protein